MAKRVDTMDNDFEMAAALYYMSVCNYFFHVYRNYNLKASKRKRRKWMSSIFRNRTRASMTEMLEEMMPRPMGYFDNFCRISSEDFEMLLQKISPFISKKDTNWRNAVPPKIRLALALRFLASGDNYTSLQKLFKISHQLISSIVYEVCKALIQVLDEEVKMPQSSNEWLYKAADYAKIFPHCLGAIVCKRILLESYLQSPVVLLALVDIDYYFMFADVGFQTGMNDGKGLRNSILWDKINDNTLNLPNPCPLPGRDVDVPYVFVADSAFVLNNNVMKPYPDGQSEQSNKRVFNQQLLQARVNVENTFGMMTSVFKVFKKPLLLQHDKASLVTTTCVYLHNFLRRSTSSGSFYSPPEAFDRIVDGSWIPGTWRNEDQPTGLVSLVPTIKSDEISGEAIRDEIAEYFITRN